MHCSKELPLGVAAILQVEMSSMHLRTFFYVGRTSG